MPSPWLVAALLLSSMVVGLIPTLVDNAREILRQRLELPEDRIDRMLSAFYVAWLPGMPLAGWLLDRVANKEVLFFALLAAIAGVVGLGLSTSRRGLFGNLAFLGFAYSAIAVATVRLMPVGLNFTGSNVASLNFGFAAVGLGAALGPWLLARAARWLGPRRALLGFGFALALPALAVAFVSAEPLPAPLATGETARLFEPRFWLIALIIFLYFALETGLDVWPEKYLNEIGYQGGSRAFALFVFWAAFLLVRLAMGWLHPGFEVWLLLLLVLGSAFAMGNLAGAYGGNSGSFGLLLVGLCYGPLLPGFLALAIDFQLPAAALGYLLALSGLDVLLIRPLLMRYAQRHKVRTLMGVPTLIALVLAAPLLVLAIIHE